jgi:hypothetical protein
MRDPKSLAEWIELDYHRHPSRFWRSLRLMLGLVVLACAGLLASAHLSGNQAIYQAGPLSTAHAMFQNDCGQCHTESFQPLRRLWPGNTAVRSVTDEACLRCHDGPVHHAQQAFTPGCAACHREHRGQPSLARVASAHCTACHADLRRKDGASCEFLNVSDFCTDHPEFALWRAEVPRDPGMVRFNHHVHLHLKEEVLNRLGGKKLDCASCHQADAERRYMLPISYERHCAHCHPLSVRVVGDWEDPETEAAAARFQAKPAPHRKPETVRATLRERYTQFVQQWPAVLGPPGEDEPGPPFPGRQHPQPLTETEWAWVNHQLHRSEAVLFNGASGCRYCHPVNVAWGTNRLPDYAPPNLPARWFPHSRFRHDSHRLLQCTECHAAPASKQTGDVLLPRIGVCRQCHNPQVGARTDCIECHGYHDRGKERDWNGALALPTGDRCPADRKPLFLRAQ